MNNIKVDNIETITTDNKIKIIDNETGFIYTWNKGSKTINTLGAGNVMIDCHTFSHEKPIGSINKFEALRRMKSIIIEDRTQTR